MPPSEPTRVSDIDGVLQTPLVVRADEPISVAIARLVERPQSRAVWVVDAEGRLRGAVSFRCLLRVTRARLGSVGSGAFPLFGFFRDLLRDNVKDLARPTPSVRADTTIEEALLLLEESKQNDLPVVDGEGRVVGELNGLNLMRLALDVFRRTEADVARQRKDKA